METNCHQIKWKEQTGWQSRAEGVLFTSESLSAESFSSSYSLQYFVRELEKEKKILSISLQCKEIWWHQVTPLGQVRNIKVPAAPSRGFNVRSPPLDIL